MDANEDEQVDHHAAPPPEEVLPPSALHDVMMGNEPQLPVEAGVADSTAQADTRGEEELAGEELAEGKLGIGAVLWCRSTSIAGGLMRMGDAESF